VLANYDEADARAAASVSDHPNVLVSTCWDARA
jgi:hypothetical protein